MGLQRMVNLFIQTAQKMKPWQIIVVSILVSETLTGFIVSIMDILLHGAVTYDFMITGAVTALIVSFIIVTVIVIALNRLRENETRYYKLFESESNAVMIFDAETLRFEDGNPACLGLYGYTKEEFLSLTPKDLSFIENKLQHAPFRYQKKKDGTIIPVEIHSSIFFHQNRKKCLDVVIDLTEKIKADVDVAERKKAEDALRESNENLRKVMENSLVPMVLIDEEQRVVFHNIKFTQIFGYDLADISTVEEWWPRAYPDPSYREALKAEWNRRVEAVMREGADFVPMEAMVVCKDGNRRDIIFYFSFVGKHGLVIFHDVTERKAMEDKLIASQEMLLNAQTLAHLGNWEMDLQTGKGTWSDESYRIFGFEPGACEPSFDKFMELIHADDREAVENNLQEILSGKVPRFEFDARIIAPDGRERVIHGKLEAIIGKDGKPAKLTGVIFDITERKMHERKLEIANQELNAALEEVRQTQAVLMRSEKLAAVGTLSAGVAHEILNPLNIISTICQLLLMDERRGRIHENLNEVMLQIQRAAKITNSLRMFAREKKFDITSVDLHRLFDHTAGLMEHDLNLDNIFVDRQYDANAPLIKGDADQLAQVLMNLLTNARDVLQPRRGGIITATTKALGNGIEFIFRDNGPGMPADVVERIFDPFFTTKDPGKGTGLGLSITHRIVEDHGGTITVESREGEGTCFTIFLPKEGGIVSWPKKIKKPLRGNNDEKDGKEDTGRR